MEVEGQQAESSPKPLGEIFARPDAPASSDGDTPSPTPEVKAEESKPAEVSAPVEDKKAATDAKPESEQATSEVKAEAKTETETEKTEVISDAKPSTDWESDDNPFKKQARDTRNWATQVNAQNLKLQKQLEIINKKLDGTYDATVDDPAPDPQAIVLQAQAEGKLMGSLDAAYNHYGQGDKKKGQEFVDREIARYNELFNDNQMVQQQVWSSPSPVFTALKVLRDFDVSQKYGTTDVTELIEKIKAEQEADLEKRLTEKITKQVMDGIAMKNKAPTGINGARAATKVEGEKPATGRPLGSFFNN